MVEIDELLRLHSACRQRIRDSLSPGRPRSDTTADSLLLPSGSAYRPWSFEDYLERLFSFEGEPGWCLRPAAIHSDLDGLEPAYGLGGSIDAALHGWHAIPGTCTKLYQCLGEGIECAVCKARHFIPWPEECRAEAASHLLRMYHEERIVKGHRPVCPWTRSVCAPDFVTRTADAAVEGEDDEGFVPGEISRCCVLGCGAEEHRWTCPYTQAKRAASKEEQPAAALGSVLSAHTLSTLSSLK